jgi:outer membrane protein assembly factor BamC
MNQSRHAIAVVLSCAVALLSISACSRLPRLDEVLPDKRTEYRKSESLPDLEVPPDLTTDRIQDNLAVPEINEEGVASYSTFQERAAARKRARESSQLDEGAVQTLADEQVVFVPGAVGPAFDSLREFWTLRSVALELDDAELGVMETDWRESGDGTLREKFKVFAEPGTDGEASTVLYLSSSREGREGVDDAAGWRPLANDTARLDSLALDIRKHFGLSPTETAAAPAPAATGSEAEAAAPAEAAAASAESAPAQIFSAGEGRAFLSVPQDFALVWPRVATAIEQAGLKLLEADKARGIYRIEIPEEDRVEPEKKGIVSRLAFWRGGDEDSGERQLSVTGVGAKTEMVVLDSEGKWDVSPGASRVLTALMARLNGG